MWFDHSIAFILKYVNLSPKGPFKVYSLSVHITKAHTDSVCFTCLCMLNSAFRKGGGWGWGRGGLNYRYKH